MSRLQDVVSYIVFSGTVDSLASYFQLVRDPIDNSPEVAEFLLTALQLLTSLTSAIERGQDPSHLLLALQGTELGGTVSMLYGMLLHFQSNNLLLLIVTINSAIQFPKYNSVINNLGAESQEILSELKQGRKYYQVSKQWQY